MIYVASPYSSDDPVIREKRYELVAQFTKNMLEAGFVAFSPIVYGHQLAQRFGMKTDYQTWLNLNVGILRKCEAMYLLKLTGWEESKGVALELKMCEILHIPVVSYDESFRLMDDRWCGFVPVSF